MSTVTRWWWVRHAPVDSGGRIYGQTDPSCDTSDTLSMRGLAALLPAGAVWMTSHLSRTIDTAAAIVAAGMAAPEPLIERGFVEQSFGEWHGLAWDELRAADATVYKEFWKNPGTTAPPGGESVAQLIARVSPVIERLTEEFAGRDVVAVTHGGTIRSALALALGIDAERALGLRIDNLSLTRIDHVAGGILPTGRGGVWRVVMVNRPPDLAPGAG